MQGYRNDTPDRRGKNMPVADAPSQENEDTQLNDELPTASANPDTDSHKQANMLACAKQSLVGTGVKEVNEDQAIIREAQELISAINEQCNLIDGLRKKMSRGEEGASLPARKLKRFTPDR